MTASKGWSVNRHNIRCVSPAFMVLQHNLASEVYRNGSATLSKVAWEGLVVLYIINTNLNYSQNYG